jgi:hypothetical protein
VCAHPDCVNDEAGEAWCDACERTFCRSQGGWIPNGNDIEFRCDRCWERLRNSGHPLSSVNRYAIPDAARADATRRSFPYQESVQYGARYRVYELKCPRCGSTGSESHSFREDVHMPAGGYWHISELSKGFDHGRAFCRRRGSELLQTARMRSELYRSPLRYNLL